MTEDDIKPLLETEPFEPFTLHMTGGSTCDIDNPERVAFSPHGGALYVYTASGLKSVLSLDHVVSITWPDPPHIQGPA